MMSGLKMKNCLIQEEKVIKKNRLIQQEKSDKEDSADLFDMPPLEGDE